MIKGFLTTMIAFWSGSLTILIFLEVISEDIIQGTKNGLIWQIISWFGNPLYAGQFNALTFLKVYLFVCLLDSLEHSIFRTRKERFFIHFICNYVFNIIICKIFDIKFGFNLFCVCLLRIGQLEAQYSSIKILFFSLSVRFLGFLYFMIVLIANPNENFSGFFASLFVCHCLFFIDNYIRLMGFSYLNLKIQTEIKKYEFADKEFAEIYFEWTKEEIIIRNEILKMKTLDFSDDQIDFNKENNDYKFKNKNYIQRQIYNILKNETKYKSIKNNNDKTSNAIWFFILKEWNQKLKKIKTKKRKIKWKVCEIENKIDKYGFESIWLRNFVTWNFN